MKYSYRMENYSSFDVVGIEKHLNEMSKKGLHLVDMTPFFWKYEKGEKKDIKYSLFFKKNASYFSPTSEFDDFEDYASSLNWKRVCFFSDILILKNEEENAVDLHTDNAALIEAMIPACRKTWLVTNLLLVLFLFLQISTTQYDTVFDYYVDATRWITKGMMAVQVIYLLLYNFCYLRWMKKAKIAVESGGEIPSSHFSSKLNVILYFIAVLVLIGLGLSLPMGYQYRYFIIVFIYGVMLFAYSKFLDFLRRQKLKRLFVIILYAFSAVVLTVLLLNVLPLFKEPDSAKLSSLRLSDFGYSQKTDGSYFKYSSPLASYARFEETDAGQDHYDISLNYDVIHIKNQSLRSKIIQSFKESFYARDAKLEESKDKDWGHFKVYKATNLSNFYILENKDYYISVEVNKDKKMTPLTRKEKKMIVDKIL